ncbi:hypothetical protein EAO68_30050 [Streptomyces sp. wa22]|nr:hypothetical protein EAO68_30050 [Streptomyces sp. wa22]
MNQIREDRGRRNTLLIDAGEHPPTTRRTLIGARRRTIQQLAITLNPKAVAQSCRDKYLPTGKV